MLDLLPVCARCCIFKDAKTFCKGQSVFEGLIIAKEESASSKVFVQNTARYFISFHFRPETDRESRPRALPISVFSSELLHSTSIALERLRDCSFGLSLMCWCNKLLRT